MRPLLLLMLLIILKVLYCGNVSASDIDLESIWSKARGGKNPFASFLPKKEIKNVSKERAPTPPPLDSFKKVEVQLEKPQSSVVIELPKIKKEEPKKELPPPKIELPQLVISGVVWGTDKPQAIVNQQLVGEGDMLGEIKIVHIKKNEIRVSFKGMPFIVPVDE